jgi:Gpi18-like mannosyltransferase
MPVSDASLHRRHQMSSATSDPTRTSVQPRQLDSRPVQLGLVLGLALVLRLVAIRGPGFGYDLSVLSTWAESVAREGLSGYYPSGGNSNYPPLLFVLWPLGSAFHDGALDTALRLLSIPFDLVLGVLIYLLCRSAGVRNPVWGAALYLLNPAVILIGPFWGQLDVLGALPMIASLGATAGRRYVPAAVFAVIAALVKTQFALAGVVLLAVLLLDANWKSLVLAAISAVATAAAVFIPLALSPGRYLGILEYFVNVQQQASSYAFNLWGLFLGFQTSEGPWFPVGVAAFVLASAGSLALLRTRRDLTGILVVGFLLALALYFLPTRVHERYLYGSVAVLAVLAGLHRELRVPYVALSGVFAVTLVYVLGVGGAIQPPLIPHPLGFAARAAGVTAAVAVAAWAAILAVRALTGPTMSSPTGATDAPPAPSGSDCGSSTQ